MPVLDALFDSDAFNRRIFFPRRDVSVCKGAEDVFVDVDAIAGSSLSSAEAEPARLHLRLHPEASARARLLLFHGNGEVVSDYDDAAAVYANAGAALAVVDFRGYGQSSGIPALRSMVDDVKAVVDVVVRRSALPVIVMGRSLGSLCAAEVCGGDDPRVSAIVIESGIAKLSGLIERRGLPVPKILSGSRFDPLPKVARGRRPLLVLHGEEDTIIDVDEGQALYDASTSQQKTLARLPGRGHNDISFAPAYWSALKAFVDAV